MTRRKIRVILADGQPVVIQGLTCMLRQHPLISVVGAAGTLKDAQRVMKECDFDILVTGLNLSGHRDGLQLVRFAISKYLDSRVVVLAASERPGDIVDANQAGAHAYLLKCTGLDEIAAALETVHQGGRPPLSAELEASLWQKLKKVPPMDAPYGLTEREWEVLRMMVQGATNNEIAANLHISARMVRRANTSIYGKLGVCNRTEAVAKAVKEGWFH